MRYPLIDTLRGFSIISMVIYHTVWDIVFIFEQRLAWFYSPIEFIWQQSICWSFILISGFCQAIAHHSYRDGLIVSAAGLLVTVVSVLLPVGIEIYYGVLTFLGLAILLTALIKPALLKIPPVLGLVISAACFFITREVNRGYLGFSEFAIIDLPASWYAKDIGWITTLIGFPGRAFSSSDYFSIIPWYFLFTSGFFLARIVFQEHWTKSLETLRIKPLEFLGRHALIIYLLHQPIIYALLRLVYK